MAVKKTPSKKSAAKPKLGSQSTRVVKQPEYRSFKMSPRIRHTAGKVPSALSIVRDARTLLLQRKRLFLGIVLIHLLLTVVLVKGFSTSLDLTETKTLLQDAFAGEWSQLVTGFTLFGVLVGATGSASSDVAGAYQSMLLLIMSLVFIWALRQTHAGVKVTVKDSFYKSMYPLIPFFLVMIFITLQFVPALFGGFLYSALFISGLAVTIVEKVLFALILFLLILWSIYMVTASMFGFYIVTLPDVTPLQAIRSARELVEHRRWAVMRKILFLPVVLLVVGAAIMVPVIILVTPLAEWIFFVLSMFGLAFVHAYMYSLYRKLL